jgi:hypothetical protein
MLCLSCKQVEVLLRNELEETPELLQRIAAYDQNLPGTLRREGMRRALEAQGIAAAAAARAVATAAIAAAATQHADTQDPALQAAAEAAVAAATAAAAAKGSIPVLDGQVQFLGTSTRSLPGFGNHRMPRLGSKRGRPRKGKLAGGQAQPLLPHPACSWHLCAMRDVMPSTAVTPQQHHLCCSGCR